ncbi:MAG: hypothetical protein BA863_11285 [Desulfovibrio sp. S3730MH75]|nr:MAG: hypothetical protein BA863_11285 [Desulfovibrio sp. S3730MH75]
MRIELDRIGTAASFEKILKEICADPAVKGLLVLACDNNNFVPTNIDHVLKNCPLPLSGGIFPGIIYEKEKLDIGTIFIGLSEPPSLAIISGLSDPETNLEKNIEQSLENKHITDTILIFADGYSSRISEFINAMFINFGLENNIIGGGAGSFGNEKKHCLLSNQGMLEDCAILTLLNTKSTTNISHGWNPVKGPFKVTDAHHNVIKSLDWMPAFNIYKEAIRSHSGIFLSKENFAEISSSYPFGVAQVCCDHIVRGPFKMDDEGGLVCIGEISIGSFIDIMHGNSKSLIDSSRSSLNLDRIIGNSENSLALIIDCVSRALFLKDEFEQELKAMHLPGLPMVGILSIGEIATLKNQSLEFHNKTLVLSLLEEL